MFAQTRSDQLSQMPQEQRPKAVCIRRCGLNPEGGFLKLNVDASFSAESHSGATGDVIRNCRGDFIAASSTFIPHVGSPQMAEAIAMLHGLRLANDKGCNNIEAESDS
jgi:hypothetical protein